MASQYDKFSYLNWYAALSVYALPTAFTALKPEEITMLANGETGPEETGNVVRRLDEVMRKFSGPRFVSVDTVAPTDTERFATKRGAIVSARSAWNVLASSAKVRNAAQQGLVHCICVRSFRKMDIAREFRLFVKNGELKAASQYWLIKHFPKLEKNKEIYWQRAQDFVKECAWALPAKDVVLDVYFTTDKHTILLDVNPFGSPTDPLMLNQWDLNWNEEQGIRIVPPPHCLSGNVNVSF